MRRKFSPTGRVSTHRAGIGVFYEEGGEFSFAKKSLRSDSWLRLLPSRVNVFRNPAGTYPYMNFLNSFRIPWLQAMRCVIPVP